MCKRALDILPKKLNCFGCIRALEIVNSTSLKQKLTFYQLFVLWYMYTYVSLVFFFYLIAKEPTLSSIWIDILELAQNSCNKMERSEGLQEENS